MYDDGLMVIVIMIVQVLSWTRAAFYTFSSSKGYNGLMIVLFGSFLFCSTLSRAPNIVRITHNGTFVPSWRKFTHSSVFE